MKRSLYVRLKGREIYTGKIIGDIFYRNFPFSKAVLWQNREISIDQTVFEYLWGKVKKIVFIDTVKKTAFEIGIRKAVNHARKADYGEGVQMYINKDLLDKIDFPKIPFVEFKVVVGEAKLGPRAETTKRKRAEKIKKMEEQGQSKLF